MVEVVYNIFRIGSVNISMCRERPAAPRNILSSDEIPNATQMIAEGHTITHLDRFMQDTWCSIFSDALDGD